MLRPSKATHGTRWELTRGLVVVDADALQLKVRVSHIVATGVYTMFIADHLPELQGGKEGSAGACDPHQALPLLWTQPGYKSWGLDLKLALTPFGDFGEEPPSSVICQKVVVVNMLIHCLHVGAAWSPQSDSWFN